MQGSVKPCCKISNFTENRWNVQNWLIKGINWLHLNAHSWWLYPAFIAYHNFTSGRGYPGFCAARLESFTRCHRIYSSLERRIRYGIAVYMFTFLFCFNFYMLALLTLCISFNPTVHISQIVVESCPSRCLLHLALMRCPGCVWAFDIDLACNPTLQVD